MANYATLKAAITAAIKQNGNNEITGNLLQQQLLAMVNSLGAGYQYAGVATPSANPGTPDQNVFYIASTAGTYANFGGLVLADSEIAILKYNGTWSKDSTGAASLEKVNQLGQFMGIATPDTIPGRQTQVQFYIATTPGLYSGFDGYRVYDSDNVVIFINNNDGHWWSKISTDIPTILDIMPNVRKIDVSQFSLIQSVISNGSWLGNIGNYGAVQIPLFGKNVKSVRVLCKNGSSAIAFLKQGFNSVYEKGKSVLFSDEQPSELPLTQNEGYEYNVPSDANYLYLLTKNAGTTLNFELSFILAQETNTDNYLDIYQMSGGAVIVSGRYQTITGYDSMCIPVESGGLYEVFANDAIDTYIGCLKSQPILGENVQLCDGTTLEFALVTKGTSRIIQLPNDCNYIYFGTYNKDLGTYYTRMPIAIRDVSKIAKKPLHPRGIVYIAASDSTPQNKAMADYVCSGTNDQNVINYAISELMQSPFNSSSGEIILFAGHYSIGGFEPASRCAIVLPHGNTQYSDMNVNIDNVTIRGFVHNSDNVIIELSEAAYNAISDNYEYKVFGTRYKTYNHHSIHNVHIVIPSAQKNIICIDGSTMASLGLSNVICSVKDGGNYDATPSYIPEFGCIGIRGNFGNNNSRMYKWEDCECYGFGQGFAVGGEHLLIIHCGALYCRYGYTFNSYPESANSSIHPITIIQSGDEWNMNYPLFCTRYKNGEPRTDYKQAIEIINWTMESNQMYFALGGDFMKEETPGQYCGKFEYTIVGTGQMYEPGSLLGLHSINLEHPLAGTTSQRPNWPNQNQTYFDTTLGKMIVCKDRDNKTWVDANGAIV